MKLKLTSAGIIEGIIDGKYGRHARDMINGIPQRSIPLKWEGFPANTKAFALVCIDYDNYEEEGFAWLHWSVANIPVEITELPENCSIDIKALDRRIVQGKTSWVSELPPSNPECNRYGGPAPDKRTHEYDFKIYALKDFLKLKDGYYQNQFLKEIRGLVLDEGVLRGKYIV